MANSTKQRAKPLPFWLALVIRTKNRIQTASRQLREQRVSHYQGEIVRLENGMLVQQKKVDSFGELFSKPEFKLTPYEADRIYEAASKDRDFHLPDWVDRSNRDLMIALYAAHDPTKLPKSMQSNEGLMEQLQQAGKNWSNQLAAINQYDASIEKAQKLLRKAEEALNPSTKPKNRDSLSAKVAVFRFTGLDKMPRIFDYQATIDRKIQELRHKKNRGLNQFTQIASNHLDKIAQENLPAEDFGKLKTTFAELQKSRPEANYVHFMVANLRKKINDDSTRRLVDQIFKSYQEDTRKLTQGYQKLENSYTRKGVVYRNTLGNLGKLKGFSGFIGRIGARMTTYAQTHSEFVVAKNALKPQKENVEARAR